MICKYLNSSQNEVKRESSGICRSVEESSEMSLTLLNSGTVSVTSSYRMIP